MVWTPCDVSLTFWQPGTWWEYFQVPVLHTVPLGWMCQEWRIWGDHVGGRLYRKVCFPVSSPDLFLLLLQRVYPCGSATSQVQTDYRWISKGYYFHPTLRCNISVYGDQKHWWATAWLELWLVDFLRKKKVVQVNPDWMFKFFFFTETKKEKK